MVFINWWCNEMPINQYLCCRCQVFIQLNIENSYYHLLAGLAACDFYCRIVINNSIIEIFDLSEYWNWILNIWRGKKFARIFLKFLRAIDDTDVSRPFPIFSDWSVLLRFGPCPVLGGRLDRLVGLWLKILLPLNGVR